MSEPVFRLPSHIELTQCTTEAVVPGEFVRLHREQATDCIDNVWWNNLTALLTDPAQEPDSNWSWREIVSYYQNKRRHEAVAVRSPDGEIQAAMVYQVGFKSQLEDGKFSVFVDRLAAAPHNRENLVETPVFRGCGTGLLVYAAAHSYFLGQEGRISLVAVANVDWYERKGFQKTDKEITGEVVYELPTDRAIELLTTRGLLNENP